MPAHLALSWIATIFLTSCFLSHRVENGADGGARGDAGVDARGTDATTPDATSPDAGLSDAGPERAFQWIPLATDVEERPPGRLSHLAVYDDGGDQMIILGGYDPYGELGGCCIDPYFLFSDIWSLDLRTERWTHVGEMPLTRVRRARAHAAGQARPLDGAGHDATASARVRRRTRFEDALDDLWALQLP